MLLWARERRDASDPGEGRVRWRHRSDPRPWKIILVTNVGRPGRVGSGLGRSAERRVPLFVRLGDVFRSQTGSRARTSSRMAIASAVSGSGGGASADETIN